jgi:hypothetical protein
MRPHPTYILSELLQRAKDGQADGSDLLPEVNRDCSPSFAYRLGYVKALSDMHDAMAGQKPVAAE